VVWQRRYNGSANAYDSIDGVAVDSSGTRKRGQIYSINNMRFDSVFVLSGMRKVLDRSRRPFFRTLVRGRVGSDAERSTARKNALRGGIDAQRNIAILPALRRGIDDDGSGTRQRSWIGFGKAGAEGSRAAPSAALIPSRTFQLESPRPQIRDLSQARLRGIGRPEFVHSVQQVQLTRRGNMQIVGAATIELARFVGAEFFGRLQMRGHLAGLGGGWPRSRSIVTRVVLMSWLFEW